MEKVRFAVVGVYSIAKRHIEGIHNNKQAELIAVCDIVEEYAKKCAEALTSTIWITIRCWPTAALTAWSSAPLTRCMPSRP